MNPMLILAVSAVILIAIGFYVNFILQLQSIARSLGLKRTGSQIHGEFDGYAVSVTQSSRGGSYGSNHFLFGSDKYLNVLVHFPSSIKIAKYDNKDIESYLSISVFDERIELRLLGGFDKFSVGEIGAIIQEMLKVAKRLVNNSTLTEHPNNSQERDQQQARVNPLFGIVCIVVFVLLVIYVLITEL